MEHIAYPLSPMDLALILCVLEVGGTASSFFWFLSGNTESIRWRAARSILILVGTFAVGIATAVAAVQVGDSVTAERARVIADRYGWEPTAAHMEALDYPRSAPTGDEPVVYGVAVRADGDRLSPVQLAYNGRALILIDADGVELPTR